MCQSNPDQDNNKIFKDNLYQYTRGVRFRSNPEREGELFRKKYNFSDCKGDFKSPEALFKFSTKAFRISYWLNRACFIPKKVSFKKISL